jgi:hypothetical protein
MALIVKDRVKQQTTTTGSTDAYVLSGSFDGFDAFTEIGDGNETYYCCTDGTDFEVGRGAFTASGTTLSRAEILSSSNSGEAVNWTAGTRTIFCTQPADKAVFLDGSGNISIPGTVDGRDLATDGSKLDGIESGATADQTKADIDALGIDAATLDSLDSTSFLRSDADDSFSNQIDGTTIELAGGVTYDPPGSSGNETATDVGLALHSGARVVMGDDGYIRTIIDAQNGQPLKFGQSATGLLAGSEIYGGAQGVKLFYNTSTKLQTLTDGVEIRGDLYFEGATDDAYETKITAIDPTEDRTISLPNQSGTVMVTIGDSYRSGVSQTYSGSSYLVDGEYQEIATVTPSGSSHNYFFAGRIIAQAGQNVHTLNITVALRSNTLPDLSWTINYDEDVIGTSSQYITPVLFVKETSPASFILAVEVHNTIYGTLTADLDFFARTQADLADISVNTTDGSEISAVPTGYTAYQFTKTTALDNSDQFVFNQDVQFTGDSYNVVWDKSDNALEFADNAKAVFGAGGDLQIYHSGSNSAILDSGTGNLIIGANDFQVTNSGITENYIKAFSNGAVELYHDNSKKLETTTRGIDIDSTGSGSAAGANVTKDIVSGTFFQATYNGTLASGRTYRLLSPSTDSASEPFVWETGNSHAFNTDTVERLRIHDSGIDVNGFVRFEGSTADANETTLTVTDPTADRTITLPDATGTVPVFTTAPTSAITDGSDGQVLTTDGSGGLSFGSVAADDISAGDAAVTLTTTSGNITIDAQGDDTDIIFKGTDGGVDTTYLTLDGSLQGLAEFNHGVKTPSYFWQTTDDSVSLYSGADFEIRLTHVHNTGFKLTNSGAGTPAVELQLVDSNVAVGSDGTNLLLKSGGHIDMLEDVDFQKAIREKAYNCTGSALDPSNGTLQYKTLSANTTFTESFVDGESITLMIDDGSSYTVTWPTMTWASGSAPTLATTGYTTVVLWHRGGLYGAVVS